MSDATFHKQVIQDAGGKAKLARELGLDPRKISKWHRRGIPSRYWHRVAALVGHVTAEQLEATKPLSTETT